jgi:hypothetical protein
MYRSRESLTGRPYQRQYTTGCPPLRRGWGPLPHGAPSGPGSVTTEFGMSPFSWRRHSCLLGRDSSRPSSRAASAVPERREESRRRRHECPRHVMAQVNFPNYPKSPADIRSSEFSAGGQASTACPTCQALAIERNGSAHFLRQAENAGEIGRSIVPQRRHQKRPGTDKFRDCLFPGTRLLLRRRRLNRRHVGIVDHLIERR